MSDAASSLELVSVSKTYGMERPVHALQRDNSTHEQPGPDEQDQ